MQSSTTLCWLILVLVQECAFALQLQGLLHQGGGVVSVEESLAQWVEQQQLSLLNSDSKRFRDVEDTAPGVAQPAQSSGPATNADARASLSIPDLAALAVVASRHANMITLNMSKHVSRPMLVLRDLQKMDHAGRHKLLVELGDKSKVVAQLPNGDTELLSVAQVRQLTSSNEFWWSLDIDRLREEALALGVDCPSCSKPQLVRKALVEFEMRQWSNFTEAQQEVGVCGGHCYLREHATIAWRVEDGIGKCDWVHCKACQECHSVSHTIEMLAALNAEEEHWMGNEAEARREETISDWPSVIAAVEEAQWASHDSVSSTQQDEAFERTNKLIPSLTELAVQASTSASSVALSMSKQYSRPLLVVKNLAQMEYLGKQQLLRELGSSSKVIAQLPNDEVAMYTVDQVRVFAGFVKYVRDFDIDRLRVETNTSFADCPNCNKQKLVKKAITRFAAKLRANFSSAQVAVGACSTHCYNENHMKSDWHSAAIGVGKCDWVHCQGCHECRTIEKTSEILAALAAEQGNETGNHAAQVLSSQREALARFVPPVGSVKRYFQMADDARTDYKGTCHSWCESMPGSWNHKCLWRQLADFCGSCSLCTRGECSENCYSEDHAAKLWRQPGGGGKCEWIHCRACQECRVEQLVANKSQAMEKPASAADDTSAPAGQLLRHCKPGCYSKEHALVAWHDYAAGKGRCSWKRCWNCPECRTSESTDDVSSAAAAENSGNTTGTMPVPVQMSPAAEAEDQGNAIGKMPERAHTHLLPTVEDQGNATQKWPEPTRSYSISPAESQGNTTVELQAKADSSADSAAEERSNSTKPVQEFAAFPSTLPVESEGNKSMEMPAIAQASAALAAHTQSNDTEKTPQSAEASAALAAADQNDTAVELQAKADSSAVSASEEQGNSIKPVQELAASPSLLPVESQGNKSMEMPAIAQASAAWTAHNQGIDTNKKALSAEASAVLAAADQNDTAVELRTYADSSSVSAAQAQSNSTEPVQEFAAPSAFVPIENQGNESTDMPAIAQASAAWTAQNQSNETKKTPRFAEASSVPAAADPSDTAVELQANADSSAASTEEQMDSMESRQKFAVPSAVAPVDDQGSKSMEMPAVAQASVAWTAHNQSNETEKMPQSAEALAELAAADQGDTTVDMRASAGFSFEEQNNEADAMLLPDDDEVLSDCSPTCYSEEFALNFWYDAATGRGKCLWAQCSACRECQEIGPVTQAPQDLLADDESEISEEPPVPAEASAHLVAEDQGSELEETSAPAVAPAASSVADDSECSTECYSGVYSLAAWRDPATGRGKCVWVQCRNCPECQAGSDTAVSAAPGSTAELTDFGYNTVVDVHDDAEMLTFIKRLLEADGKYATSEDELAGLAHWFSGIEATQSYEALQQELSTKPWILVRVGAAALLTQAGYKEVARRKDDAEMTTFIKRLLDATGRMATSEYSLVALAHGYSGVKPTTSFASLQKELDTVPWVVVKPEGASNLSSTAMSGSTAFLTQSGYEAVAALDDDAEMMTFIKRWLDVSGRMSTSEPELASVAHWFSGAEDTQSFAALQEELDTKPWVVAKPTSNSSFQIVSPGSNAELSGPGYETVAALKDDAEMLIFMKRLLNATGRLATSEDELAGLAHWFSGIEATQSFAALLRELSAKAWVVDKSRDASNLTSYTASGSTAMLAESGYEAVAALKDDAEMLMFMKRLLNATGKMSTSEDELAGLAHWFSGIEATQTFAALLDELDSKAWIVDKAVSVSNVPSSAISGSTALLTEFGYEAVAALRDDAEMLTFISRLLDATGRMSTSQDELAGLAHWFSGIEAKQSFSALQEELDTKAWVVSKPVTASSLPSFAASGNTALLMESGYMSVVALKDDAEMLHFIRRLLDATGRFATSEDDLSDLAHRFSGIEGTQSFASLLHELDKQSWIVAQKATVSNSTDAANSADASTFTYVKNASIATSSTNEHVSSIAATLGECSTKCRSEEQAQLAWYSSTLDGGKCAWIQCMACKECQVANAAANELSGAEAGAAAISKAESELAARANAFANTLEALPVAEQAFFVNETVDTVSAEEQGVQVSATDSAAEDPDAEAPYTKEEIVENDEQEAHNADMEDKKEETEETEATLETWEKDEKEEPGVKEEKVVNELREESEETQVTEATSEEEEEEEDVREEKEESEQQEMKEQTHEMEETQQTQQTQRAIEACSKTCYNVDFAMIPWRDAFTDIGKCDWSYCKACVECKPPGQTLEMSEEKSMKLNKSPMSFENRVSAVDIEDSAAKRQEEASWDSE